MKEKDYLSKAAKDFTHTVELRASATTAQLFIETLGIFKPNKAFITIVKS